MLGNGVQGLQGEAGRRGVVWALEKVKERSCCCLQLPNRRSGEGEARLFRGAQGWDDRQQERAGTWQLLTPYKENSAKRVVKVMRLQRGPKSVLNLTEHPALSG